MLSPERSRTGTDFVKYTFRCTTEGVTFEVECPPAETAQCRCGSSARRVYGFAVNKASLKSQARWDPVVGQYVENDRQFRDVLAQSQEREARELNMDVNLVQVDARDQEALGELHGTGIAHRQEVAEQSARVAHDEKVSANHEERPKVLLK
jgi:hypothetical protein